MSSPDTNPSIRDDASSTPDCSPSARGSAPGALPGPGRNILLLVGPLALAIVLAAVLAPFYLRRARNQAANSLQPLPVMFTLPDFSLTERNGQTVTPATLKGKVWIADFIFTNCTGPCPMMTRQMAGLQTALASEPGIRLLTITVDPKRDTPQQLQEYARKFEADPKRWLFLTGDRQAIFDLSTQGFKMATIVESDEVKTTDHPILHSTKFVLLDRESRIRGYYDGTSPEDVTRLTADARRLAKEGQT